LIQQLTRQCALAVDNVRLYRQARDAVRVGDEFLAATSHELRRPLSEIKGFATTLLHTDMGWDEPTRQDFLGVTVREPKALLPSIAVLATAYLVVGKLGLQLAFVNASATAVWPPTGLALAAVLLLGPRVWPGILLGAFAANLTTAGSPVSSLAIAVGNTLEALVAGYLVSRFANGRRAFERPQDVFTFVLLAGLVATTVSATIGVYSLSLAGYAAWSDFVAIWLTWWLGDVGGALIVAPLLVLVWTRPQVPWGPRRAMEAVLLAAALVLTGWAVFGPSLWIPIQRYPIAFITLPVLVWAAARFGPLGSAAAAFVLSGIAVWGTLQGFGPFARADPNESLLLVQTFMGVAAVTSLALAAAVLDRWRAAETIRTAEERLRLTEARERAERALAAAQAIAHMGSWEWDLATGEMNWSDELYRILGLVPGETPSSYDALLAHVYPDDRWSVEQRVQTACATAAPLEFECRLVRPDGEVRTVHARGTVAVQPGSAFRILATAHDITELRRADEAQANLIREQAARAEAEAAVAAREEFLSVAAHELRTPVTALLGHTQLARRYLERGDPGCLQARLETIEQQARRLAKLVERLLDVAGLQRGTVSIERQQSDLTSTVGGVVEQFRLTHPALPVAVNAPGPLPVCVDASRIEQVVINLLDNAIKFAGDTMPIEVEVRSDANGAVLVSVRDHGPGIPPAERELVFERFHQAHDQRHYGGMGLGLYVSRELVEQHGGTIWIEEPDGGGARVVVRLPRGEVSDILTATRDD
jgi:signal transduction histidine kinase